MDTHKKIREHISAFADGASPPADVDLALAALQGEDGRQAWALYHLIGDVLRVDPGPPLSTGFAAAMAARLAAEPLPGKRAGGATTAATAAGAVPGVVPLASA